MPAVSNLPLQLTSFIGRERDKAELSRLLGCARLITLTGPGGAGKTRLALEVASELHDQYDAVWFVDLAAVADASLVPYAVATALGVREQRGQDTIDSLIDFCRPQHLLLLFDNCEHLVQTCASLANTLLCACPDLTVLATSRQSLGLLGEVCWSVSSLALPDETEPGEFPDIRSIAESEAVRLFFERARLRHPDLSITERNAATVAQVCRQLDGLPLAIELAAARVNVLSVDEIATRLKRNTHLLSSRTPTLPARQQTLQAAIEWSYTLLAEDEQKMLRALSVFASAFTLEAAHALNPSGPQFDEFEVLNMLGRLIDKSLVLAVERGGESRFRLLHIIRQYALEKLEESGELASVRCQHLGWYLHTAERLNSQLSVTGELAIMNRMEEDLPDYRAALAWAVDSTSGVHEEAALHLAVALRPIWYGRCYYTEGREQLARALANVPSGRRTPARAASLNALGFIARIQGDFALAKVLLDESREIFQELGDKSGEGRALVNLGFVACGVDQVEQAQSYFEQALVIGESLGDRLRLASALNGMGEVARLRSDFRGARPFYEKALAIYRNQYWPTEIPFVLISLGHVAHHEGNYAEARSYFEESLTIACEYDFRLPIAWCLVGMGGVAAAERQYFRAAKLFGAGQAISSAIAADVNPADRAQYAHYLKMSRERSNGANWERAWSEGQALSLQQAIAYARASGRDSEPAGASRKAAPASSTELTRREVEILRLLREGLSNRQIADRLFLTANTVRAHLYSIYNKLGVSNRVAAIRLGAGQ
jgi:predicted ATPase/DNA-binding CsgD family transcriptional regulator